MNSGFKMTAIEFKRKVLTEIDEAIKDNGLEPRDSGSLDHAYWSGRVDALRSLRTDVYEMNVTEEQT